jgi:hypothetical protein
LSEKGNAFLRPLKNKGFEDERVTTMRLDDLGKSTTLESNKSQSTLSPPCLVLGFHAHGEIIIA